MFLLQQILPAAVIAMMVAAGICGPALAFRNESVRRLLAPFAVGIAYAAGQIFITGWSTFPPTDTTNWLPYFAVVAAILGVLWAAQKEHIWIGLFLFALLSACALRLLLRPKFQYGWSVAQGWTWVVCLALGLTLLALIVHALYRRSTVTLEVPILLLVVCGGSFGALLLSGSMLLGQFAAVLGAAVFGTLLLAARRTSYDGIIPLFSLIQGAILVSGYFFASLPAISAALLAFALLPTLIPIRLAKPYATIAIRAVLVLVSVAAALIVAFRASPPLDY
jgi:hypothetical protein